MTPAPTIPTRFAWSGCTAVIPTALQPSPFSLHAQTRRLHPPCNELPQLGPVPGKGVVGTVHLDVAQPRAAPSPQLTGVRDRHPPVLGPVYDQQRPGRDGGHGFQRVPPL